MKPTFKTVAVDDEPQDTHTGGGGNGAHSLLKTPEAHSHKWDEGVTYFRLLGLPDGSAFHKTFETAYFGESIGVAGKGYYPVTSTQAEKLKTLSLACYAAAPEAMFRKENPNGLRIDTKLKELFIGFTLKVPHGDPTKLWQAYVLPASRENSDKLQCGTAIVRFPRATRLAGGLKYPNFLDPETGNPVSISITGAGSLRQYAQDVDDTPINVYSDAYKYDGFPQSFDEILNYATDAELGIQYKNKLGAILGHNIPPTFVTKAGKTINVKSAGKTVGQLLFELFPDSCKAFVN